MVRITTSLKTETDKQKPKLEYNDKTFDSWINIGVAYEDIPEKVRRVHEFKEDFLNRATLPIKYKINSFMRLKAQDFSTKNFARKEYLTYSVDWLAKDYLGDNITERAVMEHIEGVYQEQLKKSITKQGQIVGYERVGERAVYYIPWDRKVMDDLIKESVGSDQETIIFTVKFQMGRTQFRYDQFATMSYEELNDLNIKHRDPRQIHANLI